MYVIPLAKPPNYPDPITHVGRAPPECAMGVLTEHCRLR